MEELQKDEPSERMHGELDAYDDILEFIDSLQQEQTEADFEEELINFYGRMPEDKDMINAARHFYLLGLNARKK